MDTIANILVPVDIDDFSAPLFNVSKKLSERFGAHLNVLNIIEEQIMKTMGQLDGQMLDELIEKSQRKLDEILSVYKLPDGAYSTEVIGGQPFIEVVQKSTSRPLPDMIVVGGLSTKGKYKLGSNALKIIQMVPSHTFVLRQENEGKPVDDVQFNKILVALDFSDHALIALEQALKLKSAFDAKLHVLQVVGEDSAQTSKEMESRLKHHLSEEQIGHIDGFEAVVCKDPAREIIHAVDEGGFDLLTIGSHRRKRMLRNLFLGKVAYNVVRKADCSVFVVKMLPE